MKRLVESEATDFATEQARDVLMNVRPVVESEIRLRRVRASLDLRRSGPPRLWAFFSRPLGIALLIGAGAAAAASAGRFWAEAGDSANAELPAHPTSASKEAKEPASGAPNDEILNDEALEDGDDARETVIAEVLEPVPAPPDAGRQGASPVPTVPLEQAPVSSSRALPPMTDVERLHAAATALRRDGDPARALHLLNGMSSRGALAEEALALKVEAAQAAGDPRAQAYAQRYLSRYPEGRYAARVRKSLPTP